MIVRTADKTGYTLFSQYTMKIPSDCNRKAIIFHITLFFFFYMSLILCHVQAFYRADVKFLN